MKKTAKSILYLFTALCLGQLSFGQDTSQVISAWLKQNVIPVKSIKAGNDFTDLQPLKKILKDVQVIGMGEATHGTHEFFAFKHRLVKFLVTQMGFTAFAIEPGFSDCEPINDYILTGKGDRATVLTRQNYMAWDTEEFSAMLDWMRKYNQQVPEKKKLRFYGLDILSLQKVGRDKARGYFQKYLPEKLASIDSVIQIFDSQETNWLSRMDQTVLLQGFAPLNNLITYLTDQKDRLVGVSSPEQWRQTRQHLIVMEQSLYSNIDSLPPALASKGSSRDAYMWQNLQYLMQTGRPNTKFMVWAYNNHIKTHVDGKEECVGAFLKQELKNRYYALGMECYEGTCQTRERLPDNRWGDLKTDTIHTDPNTINWHFAQTGNPYLLLDLSQAWSNPVINKWLDTPSSFGVAYWLHRNEAESFETRRIKDYYNGIFFTQRTTPVHPTSTALARSKDRIGF